MTREDVTHLLAYIQSFDKRTVGEADALAWYDILPQDISYEAYRAAIRKHYQQTTKMMMPAELIQLAKLERPVRERLVGEPGETVCKKCSGVHYPHEDCSVLIAIQQYGVDRFWAEVDATRAENGHPPMNRSERRKWAKVAHVPVPAADEDMSGF